MHQHIEGRLTEQDSGQHLAHEITVPEGATRLNVKFGYRPRRVGKYKNLLTMSLADPHGERGGAFRGQSDEAITIGTSDATPGFIPGPLPPGQWQIRVDAYTILPGVPLEYQADVSFDYDEQPAPLTWSRGSTAARGPGWYRGDLHGHTFHSDGHWDAKGLLDFARRHQLDFVALTDHNTIAGLPEMDSLSSDDLLTIGGFELTTFYGHALALGLRQWVDWRTYNGQRSMADIMQEVEGIGGLFAIAHPAAPRAPACNGCQWEFMDMMPGAAPVVEVWNEHWSSVSNNEQAVQLWYRWLNAGHRIFATAGTDIHGEPDPSLEFAFNVIFAEDLSEAALLDGVRLGRLYMSSGPTLTFQGETESGCAAQIGESLPAERGHIVARWENCRQGDTVRLIINGQLEDTVDAASTGERTWEYDGQGKQWYVVEIRDDEGNMQALTNPIFVG